MSIPTIAIAGAGPAGLTAAYELTKHNVQALVFEKTEHVGGISRTEQYKGYRFDIGGHRFFTKVKEVEALWHEILGDDFIEVNRLSRIYYEGKFYPYPLSLSTTLINLGPLESSRILLSYIKAKARRNQPEENFEQWVTNRFGARLYQVFFKTYTEKVWGIPCTRIRADWAAQRIRDLSLTRAILDTIVKIQKPTSLIDRFRYPVHGPGMMWERCQQHIESRGGQVRLGSEVVKLRHENGFVSSILVRDDQGTTYEVAVDHVISSMPISHLVARLDPPPPDPVREAARSLSYRDFLTVALIIDEADIFPDNWIYVHSPDVQVGRIQNFKNWSSGMVPDSSKTCLGMEYFCTQGDGLWESPDSELIALATRELAHTGLADAHSVIDGTVVRQRMAYPVYDEAYMQHLSAIRAYLATFLNLQTTGRAGMHRYNNQDHSMLTALLAARNILGETHDLWSVNVERSYHEEFTTSEKAEYNSAHDGAGMHSQC